MPLAGRAEAWNHSSLVVVSGGIGDAVGDHDGCDAAEVAAAP